MSSEIAVRAQGLSKVYRIYERPEDRLIQMATLGRRRRFTEFAALSGVSLEIRRGETLGIVGRNGSGKSTLLQMICGTLQPSAGHLEVHGRIAALLELGAGFNFEFTGRENVYMNGAILGFSREEMDARFDQIVAFAAIGPFIERPVKTYSTGMFVRLAFAVATAVEPDILIVDEALAVGDEAFQRKCFARIEGIKARGGTIIFVSHGAQTVVQLCDRAILLDAGEKLLEGDPKTVVGQYQRLISSLPEAQPLVRQAIIDIRDGRAPPEEAGEARPPHQSFIRPQGYDAGLVSESRVDIGGQIAAIQDFAIIDEAGETVNLVLPKHRYRLRYKVVFAQAASNVSFGFSLRTASGLHLAGTSSRDHLDEAKVYGPGEVAEVEMAWTCHLVHGVYFLTFGVGGSFGGEDDVVFHRIMDALAFRVIGRMQERANGLIDLDLALAVT